MFEIPKQNPPRIVVYGDQKIGKTRLASTFPSPVFVRFEDGMGTLKTPSSPIVTSMKQAFDLIEYLATKPHKFKTVVIDSVSEMERLVQRTIAAAHNKVSIQSIDYGKGWGEAEMLFNNFIKALDTLTSKGMVVVLLGHAKIATVNDPAQENYDRFTIDLDKRTEPFVKRWADIIMFLKKDVVVTKIGDEKKNVASGTGERTAYLVEQPSFQAGNRYSLPDSIPIETDNPEAFWPILKNHIKESMGGKKIEG